MFPGKPSSRFSKETAGWTSTEESFLLLQWLKVGEILFDFPFMPTSLLIYLIILDKLVFKNGKNFRAPVPLVRYLTTFSGLGYSYFPLPRLQFIVAGFVDFLPYSLIWYFGHESKKVNESFSLSKGSLHIITTYLELDLFAIIFS